MLLSCLFCFFFFNDTATTEIYTLSLHDALPISFLGTIDNSLWQNVFHSLAQKVRSEEHTSELQSRLHLVCRLLLEKTHTTTGSTEPHRRPPAARTRARAFRTP